MIEEIIPAVFPYSISILSGIVKREAFLIFLAKKIANRNAKK
jgi:hypothetical protein